MTNNKAYNVRLLCELKGWDIESDEAKELYKLKILDLLNMIQAAREEKKHMTDEKGDGDGDGDGEEEEDDSWGSRFFVN